MNGFKSFILIVAMTGVLVLLGSYLYGNAGVVIALVAGRAIGRHALEKQPDRIELREAGLQAWQDAAAADRLTEPLLLLGYEQAGTFIILAQTLGVFLLIVLLMNAGKKNGDANGGVDG